MGDFDLARVCRGRSEIDILVQVSSLYGGAEVGDLKGCRAARSIGKQAMPQARLDAVRLLSMAPLCLPGTEPSSISDQSAAGE